MSQHITIRNKQHRGPISPRVASKKQRTHAFQLGRDAWRKYGKSISDNPYKGVEGEAWREGYLEAANYKQSTVVERAPEGEATGPYGYGFVVVQRSKPKRKFREQKVRGPRDNSQYLGYIKLGKNGKPRRFFPRSNNPSEDKWRNKIANKSYKEPKSEE